MYLLSSNHRELYLVSFWDFLAKIKIEKSTKNLNFITSEHLEHPLRLCLCLALTQKPAGHSLFLARGVRSFWAEAVVCNMRPKNKALQSTQNLRWELLEIFWKLFSIYILLISLIMFSCQLTGHMSLYFIINS